jgi:hypothetical protein
MTTKHFENIGTSFEIVDKGMFYKLQIGREWQCLESQEVKFESILTFEQQFSAVEHVKAFMTTALYKATFKAIEKTQATQHTK